MVCSRPQSADKRRRLSPIQNGRRRFTLDFALTGTANAILHRIARGNRLIRCIFSGELASALRFPPGSRPEKIVHSDLILALADASVLPWHANPHQNVTNSRVAYINTSHRDIIIARCKNPITMHEISNIIMYGFYHYSEIYEEHARNKQIKQATEVTLCVCLG